MSYEVLAVDGKTYGPVDVEGLKVWFREGRVVPNTRIRDLATGQEMLASDLPALRSLFVGSAAPHLSGSGRPDPHRCSHCGGAMMPGQPQCAQCGTLHGYGAQPRTLITGSLAGDRVFGFLVGVFSWMLWGLGGIGACILYFVVRRSYPIFARSLGFGLFTVLVIGLGILAVCIVGMTGLRY